nr:PREDICTED: armadillo repeat protein deleted in velo-cardio-facial syndrome [Bos mutus]
MEDCSVRSAATILASVREQEARFELLTRALEQERRHVALQLERAQQPGAGGGQSLPMAWQQLVLQEQSPGSQASLATMPEAPEVLEETVTVEEDPGTPTSHVSIVTSEDGTTRRTETKKSALRPVPGYHLGSLAAGSALALLGDSGKGGLRPGGLHWVPSCRNTRFLLGVGGLPGGGSERLPGSGDNLPDSQCDGLGAGPQPVPTASHHGWWQTEPAVSPGGSMVLTGTLWNLSSYEPLKMVIIDHGLQTLTHEVIVPNSGWEPEPNEDSKPRDAEWTTVFKNTSGCLRNVSSDGAEARRRLRECEGLVDALLHALQSAVGRKDTDNKSVENCVCIVRNLSYHVHKEVPGAERYQEAEPRPPGGSGSAQRRSREDAGCFGGKKAKEEWFHQGKRDGETDQNSDTLDLPKRTEAAKGFELLYQPEVVRLYLSLLTESRNFNTLEAAAGALQNLSAGNWVVREAPRGREASDQSVREAKAASHVLQTVWSYKELRSALQKDGWSKARFQSAAANARGPKAAPSPGGLDDSTLPLVEKSLDGEKPGGRDMIPMEALGPDGYSTMDRRERRPRGSDPAGETSEKEPLKPDPSRKAPPPGPSRPAVRLVDAVGDARPQPVDSWV